MSVFDDRERAYESDWARRAEANLRRRARLHRRLAEWAADRAGHSGPEAEAEVRRLMKADFEPRGEAAFLDAIAAASGASAEDVSDRVVAIVREEGWEDAAPPSSG